MDLVILNIKLTLTILLISNVLFLLTSNIFTVNDITGLPIVSVDADGDVKLAEYGRYILSYGGYVQESVPASDTPTTEDATITLDLSAGNYHNVVLGVDVTKFEFTNAKRGQRFLLRITHMLLLQKP